MRMIDADYLEDTLKDSCDSEFMTNAFVEFMNYVDDCPTIDAEPVRHGHWIAGMDGSYMCSECGRVFRYEIINYCAVCGAKLDGEEE